MALDDYVKRKTEEAQNAFGKKTEDSSVVDKAGLSTDSAIDSLSSPSSSSSEPSATRTPTEATAARKVSSPKKAASVYGERTREAPSEVNAAPVDLGAQISKQEPTARPVVASVETDIPIVTPEKTAAEIISTFNHGETVVIPPSYTPTPPSSEYTDTSFVAAIQKEMPYLDRVTAERHNIDGEDIISVTAYRINEDTPFVLNFNSQTSAIVPQETHDGRFDDVVVNVYNSQFIKPNPETAEFRPSSNEREIVTTDYEYVADAIPERASVILPQKTTEGLQMYLSQTHNNTVVSSSSEGFVVECFSDDGVASSIVVNPTTFTVPNASELPEELKSVYEDVRKYSEQVDRDIRATQYLYGATSVTPESIPTYSAEKIESGFDYSPLCTQPYNFLVVSSSVSSAAGEFNPSDYSSLDRVITVDIDKLLKFNPLVANALMRSAHTVNVPDDVKQELNNKNYIVYGISEYRGSFSHDDYTTSAFQSDSSVQYFVDFANENQLSASSDSFSIPRDTITSNTVFTNIKEAPKRVVDRAEPMIMPAKQLAKGMYNKGELQMGSSRYSTLILPVAYILATSGAQATAADYTKNMKIAAFRDGNLYATIEDSLRLADVDVKKIENSTHIGEARRSLHRQIHKSETELGYDKLPVRSSAALAARRKDIDRRLADSSLSSNNRDALLRYDAQLVAQDLLDNIDLYTDSAFFTLCRSTGMYRADEEININSLDDITNLRRRISIFSKRQGYEDFTKLSVKSLNNLLNNDTTSDTIKGVIRLELNARKTFSVYRDAKKMKFKRFFMMTRLLQKIDGESEISKGVMTSFRVYNSTKETIRLTRMMVRAIANYRRRHFARVNRVRAAAGKRAKLGIDGRILKTARVVGDGVNALTAATNKQIVKVAKAGVRKVAQTTQAQAISNAIAVNRTALFINANAAQARISSIAQTAASRVANTRFAHVAADFSRRAKVPLGYATRGAKRVALISQKATAATKSGFQALGKIFSTISKGANALVLAIFVGVLICVAVAWIASIAGNIMIGMGSSVEMGVTYFEDIKTENIIEDTVRELDKKDTKWLTEANEWSNHNTPHSLGFFDPNNKKNSTISKYGCDKEYTSNLIHLAGYDLGVYEKTAEGNKKVPFYKSNAKAIISCADAYIFSSYMDFADEFKQYAYKSTGENYKLPDGSDVAMPPSLWDVTHYTEVVDSAIYTCDDCNCGTHNYYCNDNAATATLAVFNSSGALKTNDIIAPYSERGCITHTAFSSNSVNAKSFCGLLHRRWNLSEASYEYYLCSPENESKGAGHNYALLKLTDCDDYSTSYREETVTIVPDRAYRYVLAPADTSCGGDSFSVSRYITGWFTKSFNSDKLKEDIAKSCTDHPHNIIRVKTADGYRDYSATTINAYIDTLSDSSGDIVIYVLCKGHYYSKCNNSCHYTISDHEVVTSAGTIKKLGHCVEHYIVNSIASDEEVEVTQLTPYHTCNGHCYGHTIGFCYGHIDALVSICSHQDITVLEPVEGKIGQYTYGGFEDNIIDPYTITAADHIRGYGMMKIEKSDDYDFYWYLWKEDSGSSLRPEMAFEKWNCDWEEEFGIVIDSEYNLSYEIDEGDIDFIIAALGGDVSTGIQKARYDFLVSVISKTMSDDISGSVYEDYSSHRFVRHVFRRYADSAFLRGIKPLNIESEIVNYDYIRGIDMNSVLPGDVVVDTSNAYIVIASSDDSLLVLDKTATSVDIVAVYSTGMEAYRLFDE